MFVNVRDLEYCKEPKCRRNAVNGFVVKRSDNGTSAINVLATDLSGINEFRANQMVMLITIFI